jgi:hypothetical protein
MHNLIGDIHGRADALQQLLNQRGYGQVNGIHRYAEIQAKIRPLL